jgi:hypothetical protein
MSNISCNKPLLLSCPTIESMGLEWITYTPSTTFRQFLNQCNQLNRVTDPLYLSSLLVLLIHRDRLLCLRIGLGPSSAMEAKKEFAFPGVFPD